MYTNKFESVINASKALKESRKIIKESISSDLKKIISELEKYPTFIKWTSRPEYTNNRVNASVKFKNYRSGLKALRLLQDKYPEYKFVGDTEPDNQFNPGILRIEIRKEAAKESKKFKESVNDITKLSPEKLVELYNDGYIELLPKYEDAAMPWDADLDYDSSTGELIFIGGFLPSGVGYAQARIPFKDIWRYFEKG